MYKYVMNINLPFNPRLTLCMTVVIRSQKWVVSEKFITSIRLPRQIFRIRYAKAKKVSERDSIFIVRKKEARDM